MPKLPTQLTQNRQQQEVNRCLIQPHKDCIVTSVTLSGLVNYLEVGTCTASKRPGGQRLPTGMDSNVPVFLIRIQDKGAVKPTTMYWTCTPQDAEVKTRPNPRPNPDPRPNPRPNPIPNPRPNPRPNIFMYVRALMCDVIVGHQMEG